MTEMDDLVRSRLRAVRHHLGWSLDELAERSGVGASTISRVETGNRSIGFDIPLSRALDVTIDELVSSDQPDDIVLKPEERRWQGVTMWPLSRPGSATQAVKMRLEAGAPKPEPQVHPGHDFMFVLEGTVNLTLGEAHHVVKAGESAEFSTMTPHSMSPVGGAAEVLMVFDRDGAKAHVHD